MELQGRQGDFQARGAELVILGSQPESIEVAERNAKSHGITYPLLHDADTNVMRNLGLWSDHMEMPWMGYLVIDQFERIVASDLQLSESKGAAPANVDEILAALDAAQSPRQSS